MREPRHPIRTSEDVVINAVGRDLYEKFFRGYTRKQWGLDPSELAASVAARIPTRTNHDDRYFTDTFQAMPREGYTRMFESMLDHPQHRVELGVDFLEIARPRRGPPTSCTPGRSTRTTPNATARCRTVRCVSSTSIWRIPRSTSAWARSITPTTSTTPGSRNSST